MWLSSDPKENYFEEELLVFSVVPGNKYDWDYPNFAYCKDGTLNLIDGWFAYG